MYNDFRNLNIYFRQMVGFPSPRGSFAVYGKALLWSVVYKLNWSISYSPPIVQRKQPHSALCALPLM